MNRLMKTTLAIAMLMMVCVVKANAQSAPDRYQSKQTGLHVIVPEGMSVTQDGEEAFIMSSAAVTFSAHPMLTENLTQDALEKGMGDVAKSAGLDIHDMKDVELNNSTLGGGYMLGNTGEGVNFIVGLAEPKENTAVVFLFTLTYAEGTESVASTILKSFEFYPDSIE